MEGAWWAGCQGIFGDKRNQHGWNTDHFYFSLNRDNCPMAEGSASGEQDGIGFGMQQDFGHFWRDPFVQIAKVLAISHKAEVCIRDSSDGAVSRQFAQSIDGEDAVDVFVR